MTCMHAPQARAELLRQNQRVSRLYDRLASQYERIMSFYDRVLFRDGREWVCSRAEGEVLELAIGTGLNLPLYGPDVFLTGIELSPAMLELARRRAQELGHRAELRLGDAHELDFADESFDTVVCTLSLCTIPDDARAVREAWRVLRPGGTFLLLEHVTSSVWPVRMMQRLLDPLSVRLQADHLVREPLVHLRDSGFVIEELQSLRLGIMERVVARKPR